MKKSEKKALKDAFNIPEPQRKSQFIAQYGDMIQQNERRLRFPVVMRYSATAVFAALILGVWGIVQTNSDFSDKFNNSDVVDDIPIVTESATEPPVTTVLTTAEFEIIAETSAVSKNTTVTETSATFTADTTVRTAVTAVSSEISQNTEKNQPPQTEAPPQNSTDVSYAATTKLTSAETTNRPKTTTTAAPRTTAKPTTTKTATQTAKPTTTKSATQTAKPTTTKSATQTAKPTTTKSATQTAKPTTNKTTTTQELNNSPPTSPPTTSEINDNVAVTSPIDHEPVPTTPPQTTPPPQETMPPATCAPGNDGSSCGSPSAEPSDNPKDNTVVPEIVYDGLLDTVPIPDDCEMPYRPKMKDPTVKKLVEESDRIVLARGIRRYYTSVGRLPFTQYDLEVYPSLYGDQKSCEYISVYVPGGYMDAQKWASLNCIDGDFPEGCNIYDDGGNTAEIKAYELYVFFLKKGSDSMPEGVYQLTGYTDISVFDNYGFSLGDPSLYYGGVSNLVELIEKLS